MPWSNRPARILMKNYATGENLYIATQCFYLTQWGALTCGKIDGNLKSKHADYPLPSVKTKYVF